MPFDLNRPGFRIIIILVIDMHDRGNHVRVHAVGVETQRCASTIRPHAIGRHGLQTGLDVGHPPLQDGLQFTQQIPAFPVADHPRPLTTIDTLDLAFSASFRKLLMEPIAHPLPQIVGNIHDVEAIFSVVRHGPHLCILYEVI